MSCLMGKDSEQVDNVNTHTCALLLAVKHTLFTAVHLTVRHFLIQIIFIALHVPNKINIFCPAKLPNADQSRLFREVSRSHTTTHDSQ
jgi:hypothetical protein